ncbi:uncharacterized protein BJX67DRAFT_187374 [Aspergillus lucknowensis]|uniref:Uncharacterized protein n=1 Tax=Aspergillus lucknowensis TaxID=176173 RepID=A0ABR4LKT4_9EURO
MIGDKALQGEWEKISGNVFKIKEHMIMEFEGVSCNILDETGKHLAGPFSEKDALVKREVRPGDNCYILYARIRFVRVSSRAAELPQYGNTICHCQSSIIHFTRPDLTRHHRHY